MWGKRYCSNMQSGILWMYYNITEAKLCFSCNIMEAKQHYNFSIMDAKLYFSRSIMNAKQFYRSICNQRGHYWHKTKSGSCTDEVELIRLKQP